MASHNILFFLIFSEFERFCFANKLCLIFLKIIYSDTSRSNKIRNMARLELCHEHNEQHFTVTRV